MEEFTGRGNNEIDVTYVVIVKRRGHILKN